LINHNQRQRRNKKGKKKGKGGSRDLSKQGGEREKQRDMI